MNIKTHPQNYEYWHVGQNHPGFYGMESLKRHAEEMFNKLFDTGWEYKIDRRF
jgi:hypothetical protein